VEITIRISSVIMTQTYGFENILIIYELFWRVGPIYISRPEIIFADFRFSTVEITISTSSVIMAQT
jgi:hypothetical protein